MVDCNFICGAFPHFKRNLSFRLSRLSLKDFFTFLFQQISEQQKKQKEQKEENPVQQEETELKVTQTGKRQTNQKRENCGK
jgi:hypothetical protein